MSLDIMGTEKCRDRLAGGQPLTIDSIAVIVIVVLHLVDCK